MSNDMEQIEARLAAYIDGVLPPEQKSEIEAYLAANPAHGRLISELKSIKSAVANLPREKAPAEVMDGVQSQLERAVLLENVEDPTAPMRVNRWPQLGAVAAMLLLTGGLGLLVYQVLPQQKSAGPDYSLLPDSTKPSLPDSELPDAPIVLDAPASRPAPVLRSYAGLQQQQQQQVFAPANEAITANASPTLPPTGAVPATRPQANAAETTQAVDAAVAALSGSEPDEAKFEKRSGTGVFPLGENARSAAPVAGPRLVVVETDDPLLTRNLWAARAASTGHAVRSGVGPALQSAADAAVLMPGPIGPGEPFLVVSDVVLPAPTTKPFAEADAAGLFAVTPPTTQPTAVVAAMSFKDATQPATRPAGPAVGDLLAVFRPHVATTAPAVNRPSTAPAAPTLTR